MPGRARKPAVERRAEIAAAAEAEFAVNGLAGTRLEAIAARIGISHPRIVQMFGSKRGLFLEVVHRTFDRIEAAFENAEPDLIGLGDAYRRLLRDEPSTGPLMLQGYAAVADAEVREVVRRRQLGLEAAIARLTGATPFEVSTLFSTGLIMTVSTVLDRPDRSADVEWSAWVLGLAGAARTGRAPGPSARPSAGS